jgi:aspartyl-tRNA synthetase
VGVEELLDLNERLLAKVLGGFGIEVSLPFPRLGYDDAIARYGSDKPDTRYGLELRELTECVRETEFNAFRATIEGDGAVRGLNAGRRELSRAQLDGLVTEATELGAKGLVWAVAEAEGWRSPVAKFLSSQEIAAMNDVLEVSEGDVVLLVADRPEAAAKVLGTLRQRLAERFGLVPTDSHALCWIVDWPLFEWSEADGRWDPLHHPFTSPAGELDPADPAPARALAYDVVWNGIELGGGSIRINRPDVQRAVFEVLGIAPEEAESRFGFLLEALRFGAPPHGGIASGLDRWVAELHGTDSIRDVIAFPKAASGADPLTGAPAPVDEAQLSELGLKLRRGGTGD